MSVIIDTEVLNDKVKLLNDQVSDIYKKVNGIQDKVDYINSNIWKGTDNKAFSLKMSGYVSDLKKMASSMQTYSNFVKAYSDAIEKADTKERELTII